MSTFNKIDLVMVNAAILAQSAQEDKDSIATAVRTALIDNKGEPNETQLEYLDSLASGCVTPSSGPDLTKKISALGVFAYNATIAPVATQPEMIALVNELVVRYNSQDGGVNTLRLALESLPGVMI